MGQDRVDMHFAAKEVSRFTSKPEEQGWSSAKRVVIEYEFQKMPEKVVVWSDADFAS